VLSPSKGANSNECEPPMCRSKRRKITINMTTIPRKNAYKNKDKKERTRATHIITMKIMGNFNQEKGGGKP